MMIDEDPDDLDGRKEIKVKVPTEQQVRLHTLKVLTGKNISQAVSEAIDLYFAEGDVAPDDEDEASVREALEGYTDP